MDKEVERAQCAIEGWYLGKTSARYESSGRGAGVISTGVGDHGGVSYGEYQLSSKQGTLREYLEQSRYGPEFKGLQPTTPAFDARWRELAKIDRGFAQDQHDFIGKTHYEQQVLRLKAAGIDLSGRGRAVQDMIWSTSVQFRNLTPRIFERGLSEKFGAGYDPSLLSDRDVVEAVQDYKINHNASLFKSSPAWQPGLLKRAHTERASLLALYEQEEFLQAHGVVIGKPRPKNETAQQNEEGPAVLNRADGQVFKMGSRGEEVRLLQQRLSRLGYVGLADNPLAIDGHFADNTRQAVRCFQRAHGLRVDGVVGRDTKLAMAEAEKAPLISERTHEDNILFRRARNGLRDLEVRFRNEVELDGAAGALASAARLAGLSRIDQVVLNMRGDRLIGVQGDLQAPSRHVVSVGLVEAVVQPLDESTRQLAGRKLSEDQAVQTRAQIEQIEHRAGLTTGMRP